MEIERNEGVEKVEPAAISQSSQQFDIKRVLKLIVQPLDSLKLSDKEFLYGIIGLASSYAGFLIWSLFTTKRLNALFNPFYELASFFNGGSRGSAFFAMYSKLIFTGLWSIIALLGVVWLVSWWQSGSQPDIKTFLTKIGGIHYIGCAGFLLASILSVSFTLSVFIIVITLLTLLLLTLYGVAREKLSLYFIVTIAGYVLLLSFVPQLLF